MNEVQGRPIIKFRNYKPSDESLVVEAAPADTRDLVSVCDTVSIEAELKTPGNESDEINIVPLKENWDLKQLAASRMARLQKRTTKAIVDMLIEKVES